MYNPEMMVNQPQLNTAQLGMPMPPEHPSSEDEARYLLEQLSLSMGVNPHQEYMRLQQKNPDRQITLDEAYKSTYDKYVKKMQRAANKSKRNIYNSEYDPTNAEIVKNTSMLQALQHEMKSLPQHEIRNMIRFVFSYIIWQLTQGTGTCRTPIGTFKRVYRKPKTIRNIKTGMYQRIPGRYTVTFKPNQSTKDAVNDPGVLMNHG